MTIASFKHHLQTAMPFGCLPSALLFVGMGFAVFVGNIMGDCEAGSGCHDNDGFHILNGVMWTLVIAMSIGVGTWLASAVLKMALRPLIGSVATNLLLVIMSLLVVWLCFNPAMDFVLKTTTLAGNL
ncbi:hypothetical protein M2337_001035 [Sphingobium sp. B2D3A]|uniref:hypothetical protein n=1 Tax=unclassified Sphingobium TaxID=2611147 RepID=UPI00222411F0|nr:MULTISPECIES: hypothetical protein [unclassified Sphingobium]MCW2336802.1 hypothetical protein [Sphingobium sp. B2D3A]MCW2351504.1 hypothetical protein [Sphingobium sp. B12D2B]MCW2365196.1 hypothetical protein [Sphingobium sp. B7D2B]MCW2370726.1 hypothetical protein [Sphingobium sp. B11D3D]MCW2386556.1 hypothetical protein [Sphingobium sp. B2D3D]